MDAVPTIRGDRSAGTANECGRETTHRDLLARALAAYEMLTALGEEVEDEWSYVNDLSSAWRTHLEAVADARGEDLAAQPIAAAIDRAIDEIGRITDPHRAIDWLSTFPQVVLVALEEEA